MEQSDSRARVIICRVKLEVDSGLLLANARRIFSRSTDAYDESRILTTTCREAGLKCNT